MHTEVKLEQDHKASVREEWGGVRSDGGSRHGSGTWEDDGDQILVTYVDVLTQEPKSVKIEKSCMGPQAYFRERWSRA